LAFLTVNMRARDGEGKRGSIICTASVAGLRSGAGGITYSASKAVHCRWFKPPQSARR